MIHCGEGNGGRALTPAIATGVALAVCCLVLCAGAAEAGDGLVALQTADPGCADDSSKVYVDCGNGTVTDNRTGLVWLRDASCLGAVEWSEAQEIVAGFSDLPADFLFKPTCTNGVCDCSLNDGSSPGEWRLPTLAEWQAMMADGVALGCSPVITADDPWGCWNENDALCEFAGTSCSFTAVLPVGYWSSTGEVRGIRANAWDISLNNGIIALSPKSITNHVWPVRGGQ